MANEKSQPLEEPQGSVIGALHETGQTLVRGQRRNVREARRQLREGRQAHEDQPQEQRHEDQPEESQAKVLLWTTNLSPSVSCSREQARN